MSALDYLETLDAYISAIRREVGPRSEVIRSDRWLIVIDCHSDVVVQMPVGPTPDHLVLALQATLKVLTSNRQAVVA